MSPKHPSPPPTVAVFMSGVVAHVAADATLAEVARKLAATEAGLLVVGAPDQLDGVISERDIVKAMATSQDVRGLRAGDLAHRDLVTCPPETSVGDAAALMLQHGLRHVLVQERGHVVGVLSARDLLVSLKQGRSA